MNIGAPWPTPSEAEARVLWTQTKLHRWAGDDSSRRFDDLFNLVCDPATLMVAWSRVRGNTGRVLPEWMGIPPGPSRPSGARAEVLLPGGAHPNTLERKERLTGH